MKSYGLAAAVVGCFSLGVLGDSLTESEYRQVKAEAHLAATGEALVFLSDGEASGGLSAKRPALATASAATASGTVTVSNVRAEQREGTKLVDVYYDLSSSSGYKCKVQFGVTRAGSAVTVADANRTGDIGDWVSAGSNKHIVWNAGGDCPDARSFDYKVAVTATENAEQVDGEWATITIAWAAYGGRDIDVCGYWLSNTGTKYGYSYNSGTTGNSNRSLWRGDNTGTGPEYLLAGADSSHTQYRVHFNHYNTTVGSPARVDITVSGNGVTKTITSKASTRSHSAASTSDPYVTVFFDVSGTPTNITRSAEL